MYILKITVLCLSILSFTSSIAEAGHKRDDSSSSSEKLVKVIFGEVEKALIEEYFGKDKKRDHDKYYDRHESSKHKKKHKKRKGMPPGLAKRDSLPPGLQKQLEKNGRLPPGLEGRDLPYDLRKHLPKAKHGTKRIIVDKDIVLIEEGTKIILDILKDVL